MLAKNHREAYIEVKRLTDDETVRRMADQVVTVCNSIPLAIRVNIELGRELSTPAVGHQERAAKESFATRCVQEFTTQLQSVTSPVVPGGFVIPSPKYIRKIEDTTEEKSRRISAE